MTPSTKWSEWVGTDEQWDAQQLKLPRPCVYQSSSWAHHRTNFGWKSFRIVSETNLCFAQILYRSVFGTTIAWIPGGPVGNLSEINKHLLLEVRRLAKNSRTYLRLNSLQEADLSTEQSLTINEWHKVKHKLSTGLSLVYTLSNDATTRREGLSSNWGRNLRRGESRNMAPYLWQQVTVDAVADLYKQLSEYKNLAENSEIPNTETISSLISSCSSQLKIFRCDDQSGNPLAIRGALIFGDKAWDILAAVSPQGRKQYSSYVTSWALFNYCADLKIVSYDLSGVDPINNKGVYDFKHGTGAREIKYIGEWESASPLIIQPIIGRLLRYRKTS